MPVITGRWLATILLTSTILVINICQKLFPGLLPEFFTWNVTMYLLYAFIPLSLFSVAFGVLRTIAVMGLLFGVAVVYYILTVGPL